MLFRSKEIFPDTAKTDQNNRYYIDRTLLSHVLGDNIALKKLEAILHPLVFQDAEQFKGMMRLADHQLVAFDIPLLFETNAEKRFDVTVCVSAPSDIQFTRVMARPNMTSEKLAKILMRQMPDAEKQQRADYILQNDGNHDHLKHQLQNVLKSIQIRFALTNLSQHLS